MVNIDNMGKITPQFVNCYPSCTEDSITTKLIERNPKIDIGILDMDHLFSYSSGYSGGEDFIKRLIKYAESLTSKTETDPQDSKKTVTSDYSLSQASRSFTTGHDYGEANSSDQNLAQVLGGKTYKAINTGVGDHFGRFEDIFGFLSLLNGNTNEIFQDIPIVSSPNISVNHGNGYENEQSLFSFIQSAIQKGGKLLGGLGGALSGVTSALEWFVGLFGISPRLSPHFSFQANPFSATPSLSVEIKLINDSIKSFEANAKFIDHVIRQSLIRSGSFNTTGKTTTGSLFNIWMAPKLFNVSLKFGDSIIKRFYLCKLTSSITPEGIIRKPDNYPKSFPDVFSVSLNFQSILPETGDAWTSTNFFN